MTLTLHESTGLTVHSEISFPLAATSTTIASGVLTISSRWMSIRGEGNSDDTITSVVVPASFIGDVIRLQRGGSESLVMTKTLIARVANITLGADGDNFQVLCTAANTLEMYGAPETAGA